MSKEQQPEADDIIVVTFVVLRSAPVNNHPTAGAMLRGRFTLPLSILTAQETGVVAGVRIGNTLAEMDAELAKARDKYNAEHPVEDQPDETKKEVELQA